MFTLAFWKATAERVVASFIGAVLAVWGVVGFDITALDWGTALKVGGGAALVSLLKAILAVVTTGGGPSLTNSETLRADVAAERPAFSAQPTRTAGAHPGFSTPVATSGTPVGAEYVAGPAADVPEGTPVDVEPVDFYEDDEPIEDVKAAMEREPSGVTAPPTMTSGTTTVQQYDGHGAPISNPYTGKHE